MSVYIPVGPQHPIHPEAVLLKLKVEGERVVDAEVDSSFVHRGIEKALEHKTWLQGLYLVERVCGICNVAHSTCYVLNVEKLLGIEAPTRAQYLRLVIEELARIHSHMLWLGLLAHLIGFQSLFMLIFRDREKVLDLMEELTGNRITTAYNVVGGVRRDIDPALEQRIRNVLEGLRGRIKQYRKLLEEDSSVRARTIDVGILERSEAEELHAVGPVARASGVKHDVRVDDPYLVHDEVPFNVVTFETCDAWGRAMVRVEELLESVDMIIYSLDHMPSGSIRERVPLIFKVSSGESIARVEAPRGELFHYARSDGSEKPYRYRMRTPTLANLAALIRMLKRSDRVIYMADVPVIFGSIDPCICCTARVFVLEERSSRILQLKDLRKSRGG
ncbi:MAG: nickel-dependent hydrogenase large subunit [Thermofilaceae archaeon]